MTDMAPPPGGSPAPAPLTAVDPLEVTNELLRAIKNAATIASMSSIPQEIDDAGKGALAFAQAIVMLDPTRLQGGDTPEARAAAVPDQTAPAVKDGDHDGQIGES